METNLQRTIFTHSSKACSVLLANVSSCSLLSVSSRYNAVIEACSLQPDIDILPQGDQTEIGERVSAAAKKKPDPLN